MNPWISMVQTAATAVKRQSTKICNLNPFTRPGNQAYTQHTKSKYLLKISSILPLSRLVISLLVGLKSQDTCKSINILEQWIEFIVSACHNLVKTSKIQNSNQGHNLKECWCRKARPTTTLLFCSHLVHVIVLFFRYLSDGNKFLVIFSHTVPNVMGEQANRE